jgi:hypothetical protein
MTALPQPKVARRGADIYFLLTAGAGAACAYYAMLLRLPLLSIYTLRLKNLNHMPATDWPTALLILGCVVLLFAGYAVGATSVAALAEPRRAWLPIIGFPLLFATLLALVFPITSTDIYDYLFRGRMLAHYGSNPFIDIPRTFKNDPLLPYVAWRNAVSAYGPLWEGLSWLVAWPASEAPGAPANTGALLLRYLLGYKALAVLGYLVCAGAIWLALRRSAPERRWLGIYLWLWNPLVLWETAAAGHNDAWMAALIVLAAGLLVHRQGGTETRRQGDEETGGQSHVSRSAGLPVSLSIYIAALLALTAGGLIKFVAFFFGPVALAAALRKLPNRRARWWLFLGGGAACAALMALAYAPFWAGLPTLQSIGNRRALYNASWLAALRAQLGHSMPAARAETIVSTLGLALLGIGVAWASWRAWRAPERLVELFTGLALWFLFVCNPWFEPWYVIWVVALMALQPWRGRAALGIAVLCCTALMAYVVDGLFLPVFGGFADGSVARESLLSAFIYLPPLVAWGWVRFAPRRRLAHRSPAPNPTAVERDAAQA